MNPNACLPTHDELTMSWANQGYETSESDVRQFALVMTCSKFLSPKLSELPECIAKDHEELHAAIVHPCVTAACLTHAAHHP